MYVVLISMATDSALIRKSLLCLIYYSYNIYKLESY